MTSILVVDDDELVRLSLKRALKMKGYDVALANNASEGILESENKKFDVILSDIRMPKMNGIEMLKRIHSPAKNLLMTGYSEEYDKNSDFKCLMKPFDVEDLIAHIEQK